MARQKWNKRSSFGHFGAKCVNDRWGWSGVADDGSTVVLTLWIDIIHTEKPGYSYSDFNMRSIGWQTTAGNNARKKHIQHAIDHCSSLFRPVYAKAVDAKADPRAIKSCEPKDFWWQIERFNPTTGEFAARMLTPDRAV